METLLRTTNEELAEWALKSLNSLGITDYLHDKFPQGNRQEPWVHRIRFNGIDPQRLESIQQSLATMKTNRWTNMPSLSENSNWLTKIADKG